MAFSPTFDTKASEIFAWNYMVTEEIAGNTLRSISVCSKKIPNCGIFLRVRNRRNHNEAPNKMLDTISICKANPRPMKVTITLFSPNKTDDFFWLHETKRDITWNHCCDFKFVSFPPGLELAKLCVSIRWFELLEPEELENISSSKKPPPFEDPSKCLLRNLVTPFLLQPILSDINIVINGEV